MKIVVPWQYCVSKNRKVTVWRKGTPALSKEYREAKEAIKILATKSQAAHTAEGPYDVPVKVVFKLYEPDKRKRDILNYTQVACDGIEGIAYTDDALICYTVVERAGVDRDNPRMEIEISEL